MSKKVWMDGFTLKKPKMKVSKKLFKSTRSEVVQASVRANRKRAKGDIYEAK